MRHTTTHLEIELIVSAAIESGILNPEIINHK